MIILLLKKAPYRQKCWLGIKFGGLEDLWAHHQINSVNNYYRAMSMCDIWVGFHSEHKRGCSMPGSG